MTVESSSPKVKVDGSLNVLADLPVRLHLEQLKKRLHLENRQDCSDLERLIELARPLIHPRACFKVAYIDAKDQEQVTIDGIIFTSKVLRKNLEEVGRVFPYVVTIGFELEERMRQADDLLEQFYLDTIANLALSEASRELQRRLCATLALPSLSLMSPGSLSDWPIEQQRQLFSLLNGVEDAIGVRLTESMLMLPSKSVSGILFPTEVPFVACTLCPRMRCESRRAPFDKEAARKYGVISPAH